jgi:hypothetical protein
MKQVQLACPSYAQELTAPRGTTQTMSTQQTPPPPPTQSYGQPYYGMPTMPSLNGELLVFVLVWVVVFIITLASDTVDWPEFVTASVFLTAAYIISRGIAKAGKVLEGR